MVALNLVIEGGKSEHPKFLLNLSLVVGWAETDIGAG